MISPGASSRSVSLWRRSRNMFCCVSFKSSSSCSVLCSRSSAGLLMVVSWWSFDCPWGPCRPARSGSDRGPPAHEPAVHGELVRDPREGGAGEVLTDAGQLVEDGPRLDDGRPV